MVAVAYIILEVLLKTGNLSSLFTGLLVPATCYLVAAVGLNLNVGVSGELNLGQAGFMAVGAFSGVCVSGLLKASVPAVPRLILAIIVGMLLTAFVGFLIGIPVLKLQGDYLAIVTLAFGQIVMNLIMNLYVAFDSTGLKVAFVENNFYVSGKFFVFPFGEINGYSFYFFKIKCICAEPAGYFDFTVCKDEYSFTLIAYYRKHKEYERYGKHYLKEQKHLRYAYSYYGKNRYCNGRNELGF
jgi:ABC-type branched-subunit amino acid transport system permease subunit